MSAHVSANFQGHIITTSLAALPIHAPPLVQARGIRKVLGPCYTGSKNATDKTLTLDIKNGAVIRASIQPRRRRKRWVGELLYEQKKRRGMNRVSPKVAEF